MSGTVYPGPFAPKKAPATISTERQHALAERIHTYAGMPVEAFLIDVFGEPRKLADVTHIDEAVLNRILADKRDRLNTARAEMQRLTFDLMTDEQRLARAAELLD